MGVDKGVLVLIWSPLPFIPSHEGRGVSYGRLSRMLEINSQTLSFKYLTCLKLKFVELKGFCSYHSDFEYLNFFWVYHFAPGILGLVRETDRRYEI